MQPGITIIGSAVNAADLALRNVLVLRDRGPAIILDTTGRGAAILNKSNMKDLSRRSLNWYDLANRQRPVALFQLGRSEQFRSLFAAALRLLTSAAPLADATIAWATEAGYRLTKDGKVGLGALLRSISTNEIRRWFMDTQPDPAELEKLIHAIRYALAFPSVFALSEGCNSSRLPYDLQQTGVTWIESMSEHFEANEYRIVAGLAELAVADALLEQSRAPVNGRGPITVLHLFPPTTPDGKVPDWVVETSKSVRHVAVFHLFPDSALRATACAWVRETSEVWVTGPVGKISARAHKCWLTPDECLRVSSLTDGQVWLRSNGNGRALTAKAALAKLPVALAHGIRFEASQKLKRLAVNQISATAQSMAGIRGPNLDFYARLYDPEMLRNGWFKVKTGPKNSHGVDKITVTEFEQAVERELQSLSQELRTHTYVCRPLRRIQIPKADGTKRDLGICCIRDRVVQSALLQLLEPVFETEFSHFSYAFRPRRNAHQAISVARSCIRSGQAWAVTADIRKCFDMIDHEVLLDLVARKIGDQEITGLMQHLLTVDVLDFTELLPTEQGVPQGENLSPLLCNIYLDPLDKHMERLGLQFVRYADDILIFANNEEKAKSSLAALEGFLLDPLRLELKPAKTNYAEVSTGIDFLGFTLKTTTISVQETKLARAFQSAREIMATLGAENRSFLEKSEALLHFNQFVRGFRNYFALREEPEIANQLRLLDGRVEQAATELLSLDMRNDPAWICRQHFSLSADEGEDSPTLTNRPPVRDIYPTEKGAQPPQHWMTAADGVPESDAKTNLTIEGSEDGEPQPGIDSVLEHEGRLYILTHGAYVTIEGENLVIKKQKIEVYKTEIDNLGLLYLQGRGMNVAVALQMKLAERDIPVVLTPSAGQPIAVLNPLHSNRSYLRGQQVLRRGESDMVKAGLAMLSAKVANQAAVLRYFGKYRKKTNDALANELTRAADELRRLSEQLKSLDPEIADIRTAAMGLEGHAAAIYWRGIAKLAPDDLGFHRRSGQSAQDPVNQCINYIYGILYGEVWRCVVKAGLDPYFGLMHGSQRDQGSLVFDIIEEFRAPFADRLVFGMLGRGLRPESNRDGLLRTRTKRKLAKAFSKSWTKKVHWRSGTLDPAHILERQCRDLAKLVLREGDYHPFRMRW